MFQSLTKEKDIIGVTKKVIMDSTHLKIDNISGKWMIFIDIEDILEVIQLMQEAWIDRTSTKTLRQKNMKQ